MVVGKNKTKDTKPCAIPPNIPPTRGMLANQLPAFLICCSLQLTILSALVISHKATCNMCCSLIFAPLETTKNKVSLPSLSFPNSTQLPFGIGFVM